MAQNFVQDGVTLTAPVASGVTKIYTGTPIYMAITGGGVRPAHAYSGIDGISMNTCSATRDDNNYVYTDCVYQTKGVFAFLVHTGQTFVLGDDVFIVGTVDNTTAAVAGEQEGARTTVAPRAHATSGDIAIGKCVGLGSLKALGTTVGTGYIQCAIVTKDISNMANKS